MVSGCLGVQGWWRGQGEGEYRGVERGVTCDWNVTQCKTRKVYTVDQWSANF